MRVTSAVIVAMVLAAVLVFVVVKVWARGGGLPPHEFAYGAALANSEAIPAQIDTFLSLEAIDPDEIRIQTFADRKSVV